MAGRFAIFWGLAFYAFQHGELYTASLCLIIPFAGVSGMFFAVLAGAAFAYGGHWIAAGVAWGYLLACLYGNRRRINAISPSILDEGLEAAPVPAAPAKP